MDLDKIKDQFPNEIDLGKSDSGMEAMSEGKKPKKYFPSLYISDVPGIAGIPKEGYALIYFKRGRRSMTEDEDDKASASADLKIQSILLPESDGDNEDFATSMARALKDSGVEVDAEVEEDEGEDD